MRLSTSTVRVTSSSRRMITNSLKQLIGVALVSAGALLLIVSFLTGLTSSNFVLLGCLLLIIIGIILHVKLAKSGEKY